MLYNNLKYEYPPSQRIIVIGDVHGDIKRFKNILIDASIINNDLEWIAEPKNTIVVQIGDQIDSLNRSPDAEEWEVLEDINMLYFTYSLNNIALAKGGRVISLIGNHELMNVFGNFSYVSHNSMFKFREKFFEKQGTLSPILSNMSIIVKIGDLLFCHAGIRKHHLDILDSYNIDISYLNILWNRFMNGEEISEPCDTDIFNNIIASDSGILWSRTPDTDSDLNYVMTRLKCTFMFVGHTPVSSIGIQQSRIWYTDSGISRSFGTKTYQYIDITNNIISAKTIAD